MKTKTKVISIVLSISALMMLVSCQKQKAEWKGTIKEVDGVTVVKNPKEPILDEEAFVLEEELTIGEAEGREEYMFQSLTALAVNDKGDIFALDTKNHHIKVFDSDGQYKMTISRSGQGPGELYFPNSLVVTARGEIVVGNNRNISYFTTEGEFIKSIPLPEAQMLQIDIDNTGNILGTSIEREMMVYALKKYDPELNELFLFGSSPLPIVEYNKTGKRNAFPAPLSWDLINRDQVVIGDADEGYVFKIFDASGNLIRRIEKEYIPIGITQKDFDERLADYSAMNSRFEIIKKTFYRTKHFPPYWTLIADGEGRVWIWTSERTSDKEGRIYNIFDNEGRFILRVTLNGSPFVIENNRIYAIEKDEIGYHYIKRYKVTWDY